MTEQEEAERRHAEEVARDCEGMSEEQLADLIARERADAWRQALEEAARIADYFQPSAQAGIIVNRIRALGKKP